MKLHGKSKHSVAIVIIGYVVIYIVQIAIYYSFGFVAHVGPRKGTFEIVFKFNT